MYSQERGSMAASPRQVENKRQRTELAAALGYHPKMTKEIGEPGKAEAALLLHAYQAAVIELNLATVPLLVAMGAQVRPSDAQVQREESARATVLQARSKVWATYRQD
jgi:hypothetical protein